MSELSQLSAFIGSELHTCDVLRLYIAQLWRYDTVKVWLQS